MKQDINNFILLYIYYAVCISLILVWKDLLKVIDGVHSRYNRRKPVFPTTLHCDIFVHHLILSIYKLTGSPIKLAKNNLILPYFVQNLAKTFVLDCFEDQNNWCKKIIIQFSFQRAVVRVHPLSSPPRAAPNYISATTAEKERKQ